MTTDQADSLTWEAAVEWARSRPEMADLVQLCYYDDPIEAAAARFKASEEWQAIAALLPPGRDKTVLEIGAGRGIVSWAFASEGCQVQAIEPDPSMIVGSGAIRQLSSITRTPMGVVDTVGERLDFPDAMFDYVICRAVLHHVKDLDQVVREAYRVLKSGGRFLAIKEHIAETPAELSAFLASHPLQHLYHGEHAYPLKVYLRSLTQAGFATVKKFGQYSHPVTSAPAITTPALRTQLAKALGKRLPAGPASWLARRDLAFSAYRGWLTHRCRTPGRLYSFLAVKA